jgi:hypothetical protein
MSCRRPAGLEAYAGQHTLRTGVANAAGLLGILNDGRPDVSQLLAAVAQHVALAATAFSRGSHSLAGGEQQEQLQQESCHASHSCFGCKGTKKRLPDKGYSEFFR